MHCHLRHPRPVLPRPSGCNAFQLRHSRRHAPTCIASLSNETLPTDSSSSSEGPGEPSSSTSSPPLAPGDLEVLWNSVDRALLRVGKAGFQASHISSLKELLASHKLVKVQLNTPLTASISIENDIAAPAAATYLKSKGKTLLFASGGLTPEKLRETAASNVARKQRAIERRDARRQAVKNAARSRSDDDDAQARQATRQPTTPAAGGSRGALGQALQRVGKGPLERSRLLQEHEQMLWQLEEVEEPPPPERTSRPARPWLQKKRGQGPAGRRPPQ